jgi:U4/U6 small nuclear ribonucleoprotein PRP4
MNGTEDSASPDVSHDAADNKTVEEWNYRSGLYLATSGYDGLVKLWSADDWQLLRTLTTNATKVMSVDFSLDAKYLASATYNRNFQLFAVDETIS